MMCVILTLSIMTTIYPQKVEFCMGNIYAQSVSRSYRFYKIYIESAPCSAWFYSLLEGMRQVWNRQTVGTVKCDKPLKWHQSGMRSCCYCSCMCIKGTKHGPLGLTAGYLDCLTGCNYLRNQRLQEKTASSVRISLGNSDLNNVRRL